MFTKENNLISKLFIYLSYIFNTKTLFFYFYRVHKQIEYTDGI